MPIHVGVDIGGTFTDLFAIDDRTGAITAHKVDTTADAISGVLAALHKSAVAPDAIATFVVGTTLATNALIEGRTPAVAYLGTYGFTDILETRRIWRQHLFGWRWERPKSLVPYSLRFGIPGRIDWQGQEIEPLVISAVDEAVAVMRKREIKAVAVSLLFSFRNPAHERQVKDRIEAIAPEIQVVVSSDVNPEIKEYERASTTVIAAAVAPTIHTLLEDLESRLRGAGVGATLQLVKSNSGVMSAASTRTKPLEVLRSGPAGGAAAALRLSRQLDEPNVIALDIGGTTADVSVITDGVVNIAQQAELGWDVPVRTSTVDVRSVGAGGGSIASVDVAGRVHVGPRSAGATPGPACYVRGGKEPTVTDALLVAGLIDPDRFLGGSMAIDPAFARSAIEASIARPLGLTVEAAASGIYTLAAARMAQLIGEMTVQVGLDPRDYVVVGFGGAGPLFVAALANEIEALRAIVPRNPAVWSALGALFADVVHDYAHSYVAGFDEQHLDALNDIADKFLALARRDLKRDGIEDTDVGLTFAFDVRYMGQAHEITVPVIGSLPFTGAVFQQVRRDFEELHNRLYAHWRPADQCQVITVRAEARVPRRLMLPPYAGPDDGTTPTAGARTRDVWFHDQESALSAVILDRDSLSMDARIEGPAIIEEQQSNVAVPPGTYCRVNDRGDLILERIPS